MFLNTKYNYGKTNYLINLNNVMFYKKRNKYNYNKKIDLH